MIQIRCKTNLDLRHEKWPTELPCRPMVGDYIESLTQHPQFARDKDGFLLNDGMPTHYQSLTLKVVSVTFIQTKGKKILEVELHDGRNRSLRDFYAYYAPMVGTYPGAFI